LLESDEEDLFGFNYLLYGFFGGGGRSESLLEVELFYLFFLGCFCIGFLFGLGNESLESELALLFLGLFWTFSRDKDESELDYLLYYGLAFF